MATGGLMDTNVPSQLDEDDLRAEIELELPDSGADPYLMAADMDPDAPEIEIIADDDGSVVVDFDPLGMDEFWIDDRVVTINDTPSLRKQLFVLLHEAGHIILRCGDDFSDMFPGAETSKVEILKEEVMAWEEGLKLAHNLGIEIDLKLWHNFVKKNLFDYVKWAYDPDKFHAETI